MIPPGGGNDRLSDFDGVSGSAVDRGCRGFFDDGDSGAEVFGRSINSVGSMEAGTGGVCGLPTPEDTPSGCCSVVGSLFTSSHDSACSLS